MARAIERQVDSRERDEDECEPWRGQHGEKARPGKYVVTRGTEEERVFTVDNEGNYWDQVMGKRMDTEK